MNRASAWPLRNCKVSCARPTDRLDTLLQDRGPYEEFTNMNG